MDGEHLLTALDIYKALKIKHLDCSDYRIAQLLGCARSMILEVREGRTTFGEKLAPVIALELGLPLEYVLACGHAERADRAHHPDIVAAWHRVAHLIEVDNSTVFSVVYLAPGAALPHL